MLSQSKEWFILKTFLVTKLSKVSVCFMLHYVSHLLFPQQNVPFSLIKEYTLALIRCLFKLQPKRNETIEAGVKTLLSFSSVKCFLMMALRL